MRPSEAGELTNFGRELWKLRITSAASLRGDANLEDFYFCSLNTNTLIYKGQLTPEQVSMPARRTHTR